MFFGSTPTKGKTGRAFIAFKEIIMNDNQIQQSFEQLYNRYEAASKTTQGKGLIRAVIASMPLDNMVIIKLVKALSL